jgi:hypothetical protein
MRSDVASVVASGQVIAAVLAGWFWVDSHFATTEDVRAIYLEIKVDQANTELLFIERDGILDDERRRYDLLKKMVEDMSSKLMELDIG